MEKWFKHIAIVKVPITIPITVPIPYNQSSLKASIGFFESFAKDDVKLSYIPKISNIVPPLKPGIKQLMPNKKPYNISFNLFFKLSPLPHFIIMVFNLFKKRRNYIVCLIS